MRAATVSGVSDLVRRQVDDAEDDLLARQGREDAAVEVRLRGSMETCRQLQPRAREEGIGLGTRVDDGA